VVIEVKPFKNNTSGAMFDCSAREGVAACVLGGRFYAVQVGGVDHAGFKRFNIT